MKRETAKLFFLSAVPACAWAVFLIEDGLFNTGSADIREFVIGLIFLVPALIIILLRCCQRSWFTRVSPLLRISALILITGTYSASIWSRWSNRAETVHLAGGEAMIVAHVETLDEWIMIDKALLQRPAHWYESAVQVTYLSGNDRQFFSIQLPIKFLPLKSIKEM